MKEYADERRNARECNIGIGDQVLVTNLRKENKLTTTFGKDIYTVVGKKGNRLVVVDPNGVRHSRNVSQVKLYHSPGDNQDDKVVPDGERELDAEGVPDPEPSVAVQQRPRRSTRTTQRAEYVYKL
ncbi:hypothetical protein CAPTEDRAFT_199595 [Capitella teleta]|uniref:Uncharacterized protein n=1 Tax=Capitella teleta TaxID=283909 RepID=R7TK41_CAPTE|nr:hypothetical protein CAPTEDRAFT_212219 [Capitella teleta]ELT93837.1 hypothetical protein CAPTEDRAFT_193940 [Capitella teleta]ELU08636.1 hypothetical protein CAPTEDRAFT_199595 [Capitella teleta]|eukprot:ELT91215.1 hypothetical protein CAPTEDRAFT_212219 [Capitella teleta]